MFCPVLQFHAGHATSERGVWGFGGGVRWEGEFQGRAWSDALLQLRYAAAQLSEAMESDVAMEISENTSGKLRRLAPLP